MKHETLEKIVSLAKRRGFIYPGSEIYGGFSGFWDFGPLGVELKNNIKKEWWKMFVLQREDMFGIESSIIMNPKVWEASGHLEGFVDLLAECKKCKKRFRTDQFNLSKYRNINISKSQNVKISESQNVEISKSQNMEISKYGNVEMLKCPECGGKLTEPKKFNTMFKTFIGAAEDSASTAYLRPETAQGMFVNFKNIIDSYHPKLPFGLAQIGKGFRNEITPGNFIFRVREFEMMEIEYFVRESQWEKWFKYWLCEMRNWMEFLGLKKDKIFEREVGEKDRAHYSKKTIDIDYQFPFGREELYGLAFRADFDLKAHGEKSGVDLSYYDEETKEKFIPQVIEPTFGVERTVLALLCGAYDEDEMGGEKRAVLRLKPKLAPVKAAVFPLLANKPELVKKAREVFETVKKEIPETAWDDIGNIGKRYRRQDEIGTPWCLTIDFQTLEDDTLTIRDRDTGKQERVAISEIINFLEEKLE